MKKLSKERMRPIRDEVYHIIRNAILRDVYKPGDKLQEEELAAQLGTSRTPVREALRKLEVENFVTYYPHRGTVVAEVSADEVEELYQIRTMVECFIMRRAAVRATGEDVARLRNILEEVESATTDEDILDTVELFNDTLFEISDSTTLVDLNQKIRTTLQRVVANNHLNPERSKHAHEEHVKIVDALEANDPDLVEQYTREHLGNSPRRLKMQ